MYKEMKQIEEEAGSRKELHVDFRRKITEMEKGLKAAGDRVTQADKARKSAQAQEADMNQRLLELKRQVSAVLWYCCGFDGRPAESTQCESLVSGRG